jgi:hypothetical protein
MAQWRMPAGFDVVGHMKHPPYFGVSQDPGHEAAVSSFCHEMTVRNVRGIALFDHEDGESTKRLTTIAMVCRALVRPLGKPLKGQLTGKFALRQAFLIDPAVMYLNNSTSDWEDGNDRHENAVARLRQVIRLRKTGLYDAIAAQTGLSRTGVFDI